MNNEELRAMRARHTLEIKKFRDACPHKKVSSWMPYEWAPGHMSGYVRVCERCEKIVEKKED